MSSLNAALRAVVDLLNTPLEGLAPIWGVLIWSIPVGVFALVVFGRTSNQAKIAATKRKIFAALFEIRLFNDDLGAILRAQVEILRHVITYQGLSLVPMIFILPPLLLVMVQLHAFYGFRGLEPGEKTLLEVSLAEQAPGARPQLALDLPSGLAIETGPVWLAATSEVVWRLRADTPGDYQVTVHVGGDRLTKTVSVTDATVRLSPERPGPSFLSQLEWPSEDPLPAGGPATAITLAYPVATMSFLGFDMEWEYAWMVVFFVLTMVVALALKKPLGIEL